MTRSARVPHAERPGRRPYAPQGGGCHKARDWHADRPCVAYGVALRHAPRTRSGWVGEVLKFVSSGVLKFGIWKCSVC